MNCFWLVLVEPGYVTSSDKNISNSMEVSFYELLNLAYTLSFETPALAGICSLSAYLSSYIVSILLSTLLA